MIKNKKPMAVFDCTVPGAHAGVTLTALEQGCHVLGEKPMAESLDDARAMVAASKKSGKIYAVTQTRRYAEPIRRARAFLESGVLGEIHTLHSDFFIGAHFGGFRDQMKHVLLLDMAIHTFDAARMLSGADPVSVQAMDWNPAGSWYSHGASAVAIFEMTRKLPSPSGGGKGGGGVIYTYRGSWCADGLSTSWECSWRIIGTKGTLVWDGGGGMRAEIVSEGGGFNSKVSPLEVPNLSSGETLGGHAGVMREFRDCVLQGGIPQTSCEDNIKSLAMVLCSIEAAESGAKVRVSW